MSMEIRNTYAAGYAGAAKKADSAKVGGSTKDGNVTTSTVELKTSTPGVTKTEQIKTGFSTVNEYSGYLQGKYGYMNSGTTSMQGVPTTVSVSGGFLKKCMNDPAKAKYLEENLKAIPDCVKSLVNHTKTMQGSPVCTYAAYIIDDNGNITCISGCTNDPDGKIAKENAERKAKEKSAEEARLSKKRAKKKEEEEKLAEKKAKERSAYKEWSQKPAESKETGNFHRAAAGTDVRSVTRSIMAATLGILPASAPGFDIKA